MLTLLVGILTVASVENESAGDKTGIDTGEGHAIEESGHQTALKFLAAEAGGDDQIEHLSQGGIIVKLFVKTALGGAREVDEAGVIN